MDAANWISLAAAIISVLAAVFSFSQANAARRQAAAAHGELDPTFQITKTSNVGPPWRFDFVANNFNRRAIELRTIEISLPRHNIYLSKEGLRDTIKSIINSVKQPELKTFDFTRSVGFTLAGVAPNSAEPARLNIGFAFSPEVGFEGAPKSVSIEIRVHWTYADEAKEHVYTLRKDFITVPEV